VTDQGDLTYLNLVHIPQIDGTDPNDLTIVKMRGRREGDLPPWRRYANSCRGCEGCEACAILEWTLGICDNAQDRRAVQPDGTDVREQARFDDAIGIFPEFIDGYGILIPDHRSVLACTLSLRSYPRASATCWLPGAASVATTYRMRRHAT